jgi:hypothetical protein
MKEAGQTSPAFLFIDSNNDYTSQKIKNVIRPIATKVANMATLFLLSSSSENNLLTNPLSFLLSQDRNNIIKAKSTIKVKPPISSCEVISYPPNSSTK